MDQIFLWGFPLPFSYSPFFQSLAIAEIGKSTGYEIFRGAEKKFRQILEEKSTIGANVTIPFKEKALNVVDSLTEEAREIGAVNTIFKRGNLLIGDNTDGSGMVLWLKDAGLLQPEMDILGNGGSARSIAYALHKEGVSLSIFGRRERGWEKKRRLPIS